MATRDTKVVISQAAGRLPKWEFDTMALGMSKRVWWDQKAPRIIKIRTSKGLREVTKVAHPNNRALLIRLPILPKRSAAYSSKKVKFEYFKGDGAILKNGQGRVYRGCPQILRL